MGPLQLFQCSMQGVQIRKCGLPRDAQGNPIKTKSQLTGGVPDRSGSSFMENVKPDDLDGLSGNMMMADSCPHFDRALMR